MLSNFEKKALKDGHRVMAGIDEAGRGPWAGPVTAAAVAVKSSNWSKLLRSPLGRLVKARGGVRDSKHLSCKQREEIFESIKNEPNIEWRVSFVYPQTIDRFNIWQATQLAWKRSLKKLSPHPDFLFLDGRMGMPGLKIKQEAVVKGDQKILLLSLASIIAKVSRDRAMERWSRKYPLYEFCRHKGYGTRLHQERLKKFGPCLIHRRSFRPVFDNLSFRDKVYYRVSRIPRGQVMTYRQIAWEIGHPNACRAVGNALNRNNNPRVPCHRVIRSDGRPGGYNRGEEMKKALLEAEKFA